MKAGILYAKDDIRCGEWETPKAGYGEIVVKMRASGICGSDIPRVLGDEAKYYPIILGHEFSGEVSEIGDGVTGFEIGDRISGAPLIPCMKCTDCAKGSYSLCKNYSFIGSRVSGSFAEYVKLPAVNAVKFSSDVSFELAAFFEPSTVAIHGVRLSGFTGGKDTAVFGGGTIGLFTMQWAKIMGAKSVTVFDISEKRLELAKKLGADYVVNTAKDGLPDPDKKFDYVFETAGQPATMIDCFEAAANKSSVCFIGTPHVPVTFTQKQWENMNRKEFRLTGSWMSYSAPFPGEEWTLTSHYFGTGDLKFDDGLIFARYSLDDIDKAFDLFRANRKQASLFHVGGKVMLINE